MASYSRRMASGCRGDSTLSSSYKQPGKNPCRTIREGVVQLTDGKHVSKLDACTHDHMLTCSYGMSGFSNIYQ